MKYPAEVIKLLASTLNMEVVLITPLLVLVNHRLLYHGGTKLNRSHGPGYQVYLIPSVVQLREAISVVYEDFLTAGLATGSDRKAAKVLET